MSKLTQSKVLGRRPVSRRSLLKAAGLGAAGVALGACAPPVAPATPAAPAQPGSAATSPTEAPQVGGEPVTLRLWHWDNFLIVPYEKEAATYKETHPNVTVKIENTPYGEFSQKMGAAIAGGTPPDITGTAGEHFTNLAGKGQLMELEPFVKSSGFDLNDFAAGSLKQTTWKGKLVSIPYSTDAMWIFYNVDAFKKAGLKTPTEYWKEGKWNWNTYLELAEKLSTGSGADKQWGSGNLGVSSEFSFIPAVASARGALFDANYTKATIAEPAAKSAYDFYYNVRKFAPGPEDAQTGTAESGKLGMWLDWELAYALNLGRTPFTYSVAPTPASPDTNKIVFCGDAPGFGIPAGAKTPQASWDFINFLLSPDPLTRVFVATAAPPPRISMISPDLWKKIPNLPDPQLAADISDLRFKSFHNGPKMSNWGEIWNVQGEEMSLVWADTQTLDAGIAKIADRWNKLIKESDIDPDAN